MLRWNWKVWMNQLKRLHTLSVAIFTRQIISNELQWTENLELSWYHGDTGNTFKIWRKKMKIICTFFTFCQIRKMSMFSPIRNKHKLIDIPIKAKFWWRFQSCHCSSVACTRRLTQRAPDESFFVIKLKFDSFVFGF